MAGQFQLARNPDSLIATVLEQANDPFRFHRCLVSMAYA
jgi:hypothetical protein